MGNREKYNAAFIESMDVSEEQLEGLAYQSVPAWDSVGHMMLIDELETAFGIQFETDDVVGFSSYETGIEILKKYNVVIE